MFVKGFVLLLLPWAGLAHFGLLNGLDKATSFALAHPNDINFDGLLGFVIAKAQIIQSLPMMPTLTPHLLKLQEIQRKVAVPRTPAKMPILGKYLLRPEAWFTNETFSKNSLKHLGIYRNWTRDTIPNPKHASYKGVPSDHCLMEILNENCYISPFCGEMMLASRTDSGYLLSHRLFYLQIMRLKGCNYNKSTFRQLTNRFCSLMLRELRSNAHLDFPAHDLALEQIVLCGIEGYGEFLNENLRNLVVLWQTPFGCYRNVEILKRSSNVIDHGCSDHTTGLGTAALALNLRFVLTERKL